MTWAIQIVARTSSYHAVQQRVRHTPHVALNTRYHAYPRHITDTVFAERDRTWNEEKGQEHACVTCAGKGGKTEWAY